MPAFDVGTSIESLSLAGHASVTLTNVAGDTLYYDSQPYPSSTTNAGSLTAGQSATFIEAMWLVSAGRTNCATLFSTDSAATTTVTGSTPSPGLTQSGARLPRWMMASPSGDSSGAQDLTNLAAAVAAVPTLTQLPDPYGGSNDSPFLTAIEIPDGLYYVDATFTLPQGVSLVLSPRCYVKAVGSAGSLAAMVDTHLNTIHKDNGIYGGVWDCNGVANVAILPRSFAHFAVAPHEVLNPVVAGIQLGDTASTSVPYEGMVPRVYITRPNAQPIGTSVGVIVNASDSHIGGPGSVIVGCQKGVVNNKGNNDFELIHVWGYPPNSYNGNSTAYLPTVGFEDNGTGTTWDRCYADSPSSYGFHFTADDPRSGMVGCRVYLSGQMPVSLNNVVNAVQLDSATTSSVSILGLKTGAGNSNVQLAADVAGNLTGAYARGTQAKYTVTVNGDIGGQGNSAIYGNLPTITTAQTLSGTQNGALINIASQGPTVSIPAANTFPASQGKTYTLKNVGTGNNYCFITAASGTVDGNSSVLLEPGDLLQVYSDGTNWRIITHLIAFATQTRAVTTPPVSGTSYQNPTFSRPAYFSAAYTPTGAGSLLLELSRDNATFTTFNNIAWSGSGSQQYLTFWVPTNWFYRLTITAGTLGTIVMAPGS